MRERPILATRPAPVSRHPAYSSTGGEDLSALIAEADAIRLRLGYARFSQLAPWCDDGSPLTTDRGGLERMIERLCVVLADQRVSNPVPSLSNNVQNTLGACGPLLGGAIDG